MQFEHQSTSRRALLKTSAVGFGYLALASLLAGCAGQLPMVSGALPATGKVGEGRGLVAPADANSYARQCALNALAAAAASVGGVDRLTGVVKVVGFVASVRVRRCRCFSRRC